MLKYLIKFLLPVLFLMQFVYGQQQIKPTSYTGYVQQFVENLMKYGTDRYGKIHAPILVSILDVETLQCPENPLPLDEDWRVTRRDRRNPAGANLLPDQPILRAMYYLSDITGKQDYADFALYSTRYYIQNLLDDKDMFWWGWHRHYDVYKDIMTGHSGNHHEIQAVHTIDWPYLWSADSVAVINEINGIWKWHVIDKRTCEVNRHNDGKPGCDFSMSAGAYIEAFTFMYVKTGNTVWLDRAKGLAQYYWDKRNHNSNLFPDRPNAGKDRFDGGAFVTSIPSLFGHSLLKAYTLTGEDMFRDYAVAVLKAYAKYGYDSNSGKFWGALDLEGNPIPGPRTLGDYAQYEPRGYLDLWEPYLLGYQYPVYTAQIYAYAYQLTGEKVFLTTAQRFAGWIAKTPVGMIETDKTWYTDYSNTFGKKGTYADKYGRIIAFYLNMFMITGKNLYLEQAQQVADTAIEKLYVNGVFKGHPAKPYYESVDGVGYLMCALLELDQVLNNPDQALKKKKVMIGNSDKSIPADLW